MMNKRLQSFCIICFLVLPVFSLRAQEYESSVLETLPSWDDEREEPVKEQWRFKNRMVELSLLNMHINVSNDLFAASNFIRDPINMIQNNGAFWKDPLVINIDDFFNGFKFDFDAIIKPVSLNFNWKDEWGFGLDIGRVDAVGNVSLSGSLVTLQETKGETFGVGAAVFADVGIPVFFFVNGFKVKLRPAVYMPLVYTEPNISYSYRSVVNPDTGAEGMRLEVNYDMRIYTVVDMRGVDTGDIGAVGQRLQDNVWGILRNNLGYDFGLGIEYPWEYWLDIGVDVVNIPVPYAAAKLNHYMDLTGEAFFDSSNIDLPDLIDSGKIPEDAYGLPEDFELQPGTNADGKAIYRPFKMLFYAAYRPFEGQVFAIIPSLGFSINRLYTQPAAVEGGLSFRWDLANLFIPVIGINYQDRKWKNSLDFALNLRAFELDLGVSFQSPDFAKSFQGAGLGVNFGLKFGW